MRTALAFVGALAALGGLATAPSTARAGGFEYSAAGTRALGRGGAFAARADDPMALFYNPANLADLSGMQLYLNAHLALFDACYRRSQDENYGTNFSGPARNSTFGSIGDPLPSGYDAARFREVCNSGPPGFVPELVWTWRIMNELGVGVGLVAPAAVGATRWGRPSDGTVRYPDHASGRLPSPARYGLVEADLLLAWPTVGVGYRPHKRFRIGAAAGFGIGVLNFTSYVRPIGESENFDSDVRADLHVTDFFIPRVTVSAHAVPTDALDVMVGFTWTDDIDAEGRVDLESFVYGDETTVGANCRRGAADDPCARRVDGRLDAPQPWQLTFGVRYAQRTRERPDDASVIERLSGRTEDQMANERWDIELNVVYERNSLVDDFVMTLEGMPVLATDIGPDTPLPETTVLPHRWKDQVSVRLGGDYNLIPGLAAVRAGFHFETPGVEKGYELHDFMPFMRFGGHVGLSLRVGRLDVALAYAYIRNETRTLDRSDARFHQVVAQGNPDPTMRAETDGAVVNAGRYSSSFNVVSLGVAYRFE